MMFTHFEQKNMSAKLVQIFAILLLHFRSVPLHMLALIHSLCNTKLHKFTLLDEWLVVQTLLRLFILLVRVIKAWELNHAVVNERSQNRNDEPSTLDQRQQFQLLTAARIRPDVINVWLYPTIDRQ